MHTRPTIKERVSTLNWEISGLETAFAHDEDLTAHVDAICALRRRLDTLASELSSKVAAINAAARGAT